MRIHSLSGQSTHLGDGSASPVPPAGARRPEEESSPRSYRQPRGIAGDKLAPMRGPGMGGMRGSIADTIASARASLKNPSRPFTPADPMRRLSAHSLLPRADYGVAPPTPLIETSNFEGERPFTQHRRKTPLPAPGGLGAPAGVLGPLGGVSSLAGVGQRQADILSLEDDDACDVGPQGPTQHSSLRSGRRENVLRKEKGSRDNTSLTRGGRASSADDSASAVWNALEAQLPVLVKKGRESGSGSGGEAMRVMAACDSILSQVTDLDTVQALTTEERTAVVKAAASCLEMKEPVELMAKVGKVILAVTKGGANLLAVAKLLFRLSKNSANDETLRSEGVGEAVLAAVAAGGRLESVLGHIARLSEQCEQEVEAVMLLFAVLKNMSTDSDEVRRSLMRHSVLSTVTAWVRALVRERRSHMGGSVWGTRATDSSAGGESGALGVGGGVRRMNVELHVRSVLSQSLALMRNLAVLSAQRDEFVACGTIRGVVEVISLWGEDQELLLNASRLLSKVSMTPSCQDEMAAIEPAVHSVLLGVLERERDKLPLVVRVLFVLGSLTASEEEHRIKMLAHEGAVDLLLSLLVTHVDAILHSTSAQCAPHAGAGAGTSSSSSSSSPCGAADAGEDAGGGAAVAVTNHPSQDTLVKLVRLLAHLAISPEVGPEMAKSSKVEAVLRLLEHVPMHASEELILNTVSLVTNLTYYTLSESVLWARRLELLPLLAEMLFVENQEAVLEAARAFGNLSRCPQVWGWGSGRWDIGLGVWELWYHRGLEGYSLGFWSRLLFWAMVSVMIVGMRLGYDRWNAVHGTGIQILCSMAGADESAQHLAYRPLPTLSPPPLSPPLPLPLPLPLCPSPSPIHSVRFARR
jgi:hypothetical protein